MSDILKKAHQYSLQFSCRIPLRTELKASEREALKANLQELDPTHYQIFDAGIQVPQRGPAPLYQVFRQYNMDGGAVATAPSFFIGTDAITIYHLIKAGERTFHHDISLQAKDLNKKMETSLFKVAEILKGLRFSRAGKIFEIVIPYSAGDKPALLKKILADNSADIAVVQLVFNRIVAGSSGKLMNINTQVIFQQMKLEDNFNLMVKVDINNRDLANSMEPRDVAAVWKEADELIGASLEAVTL
ncbi:MAG: hypothetical protein CO113_16310 [Elusimicrobia bacterium CG_4_9_14_3_um_filter_62_55]|nr:MAG: hypothetical protein COR54_18555 [Elusimicrobia bacterium CG22_combo_CG10-13_8_21_14_all_63_91]PJA18032.1 MAG: hypothetical protein COX66_02400 [Elusimicrobia bacterium CG_4_10_14_0_2_um_filter_63_34]PJB23888.1 MAG: hypothetical protein CO113_16310 [Elusimicrobia bacterium CG_4_9_14_3_um_filter_62_55]